MKHIKNHIHTIKGIQVILDSDLAKLYETQTKVFNQTIKRNIQRFPKDFMFQLNKYEVDHLVTICDHLNLSKFSYQMPYAFTEQGVAMLSGLLRSKKAIEINIQIMRAFVNMRRIIEKNISIISRIDSVERKQIEYQIKTDKNFDQIFKSINNKEIKQKIFYEGEVFNAHKFVSNIISQAKKNIILIDNYIDENTLVLFSESKVKITIYTKNITEKLKLDVNKYNKQYSTIKLVQFNKSHDRFLIIDNKKIYQFGASLKDLGKKWFGVSKFDNNTIKMIENI